MPAIKSSIDEIRIQNFKFFPKLEKPIKLDGKHLLLFGENGSGKSSIYWALYTLLECANKEDAKEIKKYFEPNNNERLLNVHIRPNTPDWVEPYIEITLKDGSPSYRVSLDDTALNANTEAQESNLSSDFINYRNLLSLYNFAHSEDVDLIGFFNYAVFPYVKFTDIKIGTRSTGGVTEDIFERNANKLFKLVNEGPKKNRKTKQGKDRFPISKEPEHSDYKNLVERFKKEVESLLATITSEGNDILKNDLGFNFGFKLSLDWEKHLKPSKKYLNPNNELITAVRFPNDVSSLPDKNFSKDPFLLTEQQFKKPEFKIWLDITDYENETDVVKKPHSFLNEARLTALGLAIRLGVLKRSVSEDAKLKILVLDDLLISLDMSNRETVLKLIFERYIEQYQLLILTHDKVFFEFVKLFIRLKSKLEDWQISELYAGKDKATGNGYPVIIDSDFGYFEKAEKYFEAKDYTACALFIRKELERLVTERLPDEFKVSVDGRPKDLKVLWEKCIDRYAQLGHNVSQAIKEGFEQTKLMLLNPQAHHVLSYPVYKLELENAFKLINDIKILCPIPVSTILLSKGMKLQFKHSSENYSFNFELLSDFSIDGLNGATSVSWPKCRVQSWQYNGVEFWDFTMSNPIILKKPIEHSLKQILDTHTANVRIPLGITQAIFLKHTKVVNGIWTLQELINKSGVIV